MPWPTSSYSSYILLTQITYAVSFAQGARCQNAISNYRSVCISGAGEMISTYIYMYEHIEKTEKIFPGKSKIFQKNVQIINTEVHEP